MSENVLVTGGAGYIGSHVCLALQNAGYTPIVVDNLSRGHIEQVIGLFHNTDISDIRAIIEIIQAYDIESVIHLAAFAYVEESVKYPDRYYYNNVAKSLAFLRALRRSKRIKNLVFSSSCSVYGENFNNGVSFTESDVPLPANPYAAGKSAVEDAVLWFGRAYGFETTSLRYFNVAGAVPEEGLGELHNPETHLIPRLLACAAGELESIKIYGTGLNTDDGTCVRDYVHVMDVAEAHIAVLNKESDCPIYNIGSGRGYSILEIIKEVQTITGKPILFETLDRRPGDVESAVADISRIKTELGWSPKRNLTDIITSAWQWKQQQKEHVNG